MSYKKIRFITDSTCDIPAEYIERFQIAVVPCFINYGGSSYADDGIELVREDYYDKLPSLRPFPTTSAMPPALVEQAVGEALSEADHVIAVTASSKLSGVNNAFRLGMQKFPQDRVTLIDSLSTTLGLGWQVIIGAETAAETGEVEHVVETIARVREAQRVYAALGTLEFLHRGGRVGWAAAGIATLLQIKPIIEVRDGEVHSLARVRTFRRALDEMIGRLRALGPLDRLGILYAADHDAAHELYDRIRDIAPADTVYVRINPAVGTHIGPEGLGFSPVLKSWRL